MIAVYSEAEIRHRPEYEFEGNGFVLRRHPEAAGRADAIRAALHSELGVAAVPPNPVSARDLEAVHDRDYLRFLEEISKTDTVVGPDTFALRGIARVPQNPMAALGYYGTDPATPIGRGTWEPVRAAASVAWTAADLVAGGGETHYAICRPPGHHAGRDYFGGFCYLNNAAVAAERLRPLGRVAILDFDYHHGNGTQDIYYRSSDVLFASVHIDPEYGFPHFYGFADETGDGEGAGFNRNMPLPKTATVDDYRRAVDEVLVMIADFAPASLVVSVGYDAYEGDPVGGLCLSFDEFQRIGSQIRSLGVPTVLVQEGGYSMDDIGRCAVAFVSGMLG